MKGMTGIDPKEAEIICSPDCERVDFRLTISVGPLDINAIKTFFEAQFADMQNPTASPTGNDLNPAHVQHWQNPEYVNLSDKTSSLKICNFNERHNNFQGHGDSLVLFQNI